MRGYITRMFPVKTSRGIQFIAVYLTLPSNAVRRIRHSRPLVVIKSELVRRVTLYTERITALSLYCTFERPLAYAPISLIFTPVVFPLSRDIAEFSTIFVNVS